ncbi:MAG: ATP-binding protein [Burkholderiaceae bacterium]
MRPVSESVSLRARLMWPIALALLLAGALQAGLAYRAALVQADQMFDDQMRQLALVLRLGADAANLSALETLDYSVQVLGDDGRVLYQSSRRRLVPGAAVAGYSVVRESDSQYRVYALRNRDQWVQVSQDLDARADRARAMAWRAALPTAVLVPLVTGLVLWGVRRSLRPLERVRRQLDARRFGELAPVSMVGVPTEAVPLVRTMNDLFARLQRAYEAQAHFVADAAHELRTPLAALRVQVDNLARADDPAGREAALAALAGGVQRASRLVDQMLDLARQEALSERALPSEPVDLLALSREVIAEQAPLAARADIDLGLHESVAPHTTGDAGALAIMLRNLIANALRHAPPGSAVDVSLIRRPEFIEWVVEDAGPGIAPEARERVRDRFHRGDDGSGSGLGLAIVTAIAQRHGGELLLAGSPRLGGLRASVRLPGGQA